MTYEISVKNKHGKPYENVKIWFVNETYDSTIFKRTDGNGQAEFVLNGGYWSINLAGMPKYREFKVHDGSIGEGNATLVYDPARLESENRIIRLRKTVPLDTVDVRGQMLKGVIPGHCLTHVVLRGSAGKAVVDVPVHAVSVEDSIIYIGKTNYKSTASFQLPATGDYAIDVDGIRNYFFSGPITEPGIIELSKAYERSVVNENIVNDTVRQMLTPNQKPGHARTLFEMEVVGSGHQLLVDEVVILQQVIGGKVYVGKTDPKGKVKFLLPNGDIYMLHYLYQRDVDSYDLTKMKGGGTITSKRSYRPDPKLAHPEQYIPSPENLFLQEFDQFITEQDTRAADKPVRIFLSWGNNKVNGKTKQAILEIDVVSANSESQVINNRAPVNLSFVIDRSGSMAGYDRMDILKETMHGFVESLLPSDNLSLITFNDEAFLEFGMQQVGGSKTEISQYVNEIVTGGGTNIYKGMVMGYEELLRMKGNHYNSMLFLLTDGYGSTEPSVIVSKSREYNNKGLEISTIGLGEDYNYSLLSLLSSESGGHVQQARASSHIKEAFAHLATNLLNPIGEDARLSIAFNRQIRFNEMYGLSVVKKSTDRIEANLGNIYPNGRKKALADFLLFQPDETIEQEPVVVTVSYTDPATKLVKSTSEKASLTWDVNTGEFELLMESQQKKLYAIAVMNQSIKVMAEAFAAGDIEMARAVIERAQAQVKDLYPKAEDEDILNLVAEMTNYGKAINNYMAKQLMEDQMR